MRPREEYERVRALLDQGFNDCQVARTTGIPRGTIRQWRHEGPPGKYGGPRGKSCPICHEGDIEGSAYAYLLGIYLGDGYIVKHPNKDSYKLRVFLDQRYPGIIEECGHTIRIAFPTAARNVAFYQREGCIEVYSYWKHWPCVFPQHGPGPKHLREMRLEPWQEWIVAFHPERLLRGLIHSDGWRGTNRVTRSLRNGPKRYEYPRYEFSNYSDHIRSIFCRACDAYGVRWRYMNWNKISIARRDDVAKLDLVVGLKH
ncbi:MAG: helix-turn-helix domain-containing protein [Actinomycetota bacterium]